MIFIQQARAAASRLLDELLTWIAVHHDIVQICTFASLEVLEACLYIRKASQVTVHYFLPFGVAPDLRAATDGLLPTRLALPGCWAAFCPAPLAPSGAGASRGFAAEPFTNLPCPLVRMPCHAAALGRTGAPRFAPLSLPLPAPKAFPGLTPVHRHTGICRLSGQQAMAVVTEYLCKSSQGPSGQVSPPGLQPTCEMPRFAKLLEQVHMMIMQNLPEVSPSLHDEEAYPCYKASSAWSHHAADQLLTGLQADISCFSGVGVALASEATWHVFITQPLTMCQARGAMDL